MAEKKMDNGTIRLVDRPAREPKKIVRRLNQEDRDRALAAIRAGMDGYRRRTGGRADQV